MKYKIQTAMIQDLKAEYGDILSKYNLELTYTDPCGDVEFNEYSITINTLEELTNLEREFAERCKKKRWWGLILKGNKITIYDNFIE